jgi:starvation-inducible DNA-binding protein
MKRNNWGKRAEDALRASEENLRLTPWYLRSTHKICDRLNEVATASLIETWIDESERRARFLREAADAR